MVHANARTNLFARHLKDGAPGFLDESRGPSTQDRSICSPAMDLIASGRRRYLIADDEADPFTVFELALGDGEGGFSDAALSRGDC